MDIQVNRTHRDDGALVFEIVVTNPPTLKFNQDDKEILDMLQNIQNELHKVDKEADFVREDVQQHIHLAKKRIISETNKKLCSSIDNQLEFKFKPMCQEIYNWAYDHQTQALQSWMTENDPVRIKYY